MTTETDLQKSIAQALAALAGDPSQISVHEVIIESAAQDTSTSTDTTK